MLSYSWLFLLSLQEKSQLQKTCVVSLHTSWGVPSHIWVVPSCIWVIPSCVIGSTSWGVLHIQIILSHIISCVLFCCLLRTVAVSCTYILCQGSFASNSVVDLFHHIAVCFVHFGLRAVCSDVVIRIRLGWYCWPIPFNGEVFFFCCCFS